MPFAIVFRGPEISELKKSPDEMETVMITVYNARWV